MEKGGGKRKFSKIKKFLRRKKALFSKITKILKNGNFFIDCLYNSGETKKLSLKNGQFQTWQDVKKGKAKQAKKANF